MDQGEGSLARQAGREGQTRRSGRIMSSAGSVLALWADTLWCGDDDRSGPRIVDSVLSEISTGFQAAVFTATCSKYTASGVRRSSAV